MRRSQPLDEPLHELPMWRPRDPRQVGTEQERIQQVVIEAGTESCFAEAPWVVEIDVGIEEPREVLQILRAVGGTVEPRDHLEECDRRQGSNGNAQTAAG